MARQMILASERIDASRAAELGLVNELVEPGQTVARSIELALAIARKPTIAVRVAKTAAQLVADGGVGEAALAAERIGGALLFGTSDVHRAVREWSDSAKRSD
jgi:enoyl-CoA hydratase